MLDYNHLTIGEEIPDQLKTIATPTVIKLTLEDAFRIQNQGPWPEGFTQDDYDSLIKIYHEYLSAHQLEEQGKTYWKASPEINQATWAQRNS